MIRPAAPGWSEGATINSDDGVSLVEIVVSMLMLALLAIAFLPVLIQGLQVAAANATRSTANQLVQLQMETARSQADDCSNIVGLETVAVSNVVDPRNVTLITTRDAGDCPASYPGTVSFTVTVRRQDTNEVLSSATTLVYVANG
jgi:type II secretory pathway pseudopilin PulG